MPHRDPRRALLHARALSHERTILPGADPGLCHRNCLGVIGVGRVPWAPSAKVVGRTHPPSLRSPRSFCCRPRLRSVSTPSPSPPRCPQEVCKPRLMYDGNRNLASVRSSCRRASLPPCTARHHYDCMLPVDCVGVGVSAGPRVGVGCRSTCTHRLPHPLEGLTFG